MAFKVNACKIAGVEEEEEEAEEEEFTSKFD